MLTDFFSTSPRKKHYDVVIIGGAIMGSSVSWFLSSNKDFSGNILVIERDPTYEKCSTAHTNSCIRQQYSNEANIKISQFTADFIQNLSRYMPDDSRISDLPIQNYGYLYLANTDAFANQLKHNQQIQLNSGAETRLLSPRELKEVFPFFNIDDIKLGSYNNKDEGYWQGGTLFDWFRRKSNENGVEYLASEVVSIALNKNQTAVESVKLESGDVISFGHVVNAAGTRASVVANMAGLSIPVEPRKRYSYVFKSEKPLSCELPLTIDPSGAHVRQDGPDTYLAGGYGQPDNAVDYDDFTIDNDVWLTHVWPAIAHRIPAFESIKVITEWAGHYSYNTLDQNAIVGPHSEVKNFIFVNGFSGHGLQQAPAMGRGVSEWILYNEYRSLDLSPFSFDRIKNNRPFLEKAVI